MKGENKIWVTCSCGKKNELTLLNIQYRKHEYSSDCAVHEKVCIDRYYVVCKKCGGRVNVARIATDVMKRAAKDRK